MVLNQFLARPSLFDDDNEDVVSDQEQDWEEKYYSAFNDCVRMTNYSQDVTIKLKATQEENSALKNDLEQALENIRLLKSKKNCIAENLTTKNQKLEKAE